MITSQVAAFLGKSLDLNLVIDIVAFSVPVTVAEHS